MPKTLNIIGCGKVGKTLGRLWNKNETFVIQDILNRSNDSAMTAVDFIGTGRAVHELTDLRAADVFMIGTGDDEIAAVIAQLDSTHLLEANSIMFHCSGALPSLVLRSRIPSEMAVASVHPIRSFADPDQAAQDFTGTFCGVEGDPHALEVLLPALSAIGAQPVMINPDFKSLYHSAAVFASNYLVTLIDVALNAYIKTGVPESTALALMEPLVRGTVDNVFRLGPTDALTGPVARGDIETVAKQQQAVTAWDECRGRLYDQFAQLTADIAARKNLQRV